MLSKKHFIEFADFLVEEELKIIPRYNQLKADIELVLNNTNEPLSNKQVYLIYSKLLCGIVGRCG